MSANKGKGMQKSRAPVDIPTEKALLGCIIKSETIALNAISQLTSEMFSQQPHKYIFEACKKLQQSGSAIDPFIVQNQMAEDGRDFAGSMDYILKIAGEIFDTTNWESYIEILSKNLKFQQIIDAGSALINIGNTSTDLVEASKRVSDIFVEVSSVKTDEEGTLHVKESIVPYMHKIGKAIDNPNIFGGLFTGFKIFDDITNGLQRNSVYVLAARPGVGKTSYALNIVNNIIKREESLDKDDRSIIAFFCLEMSREDLIHRLMSMYTQVDFERIRKAKLNGSELDKLVVASIDFENTNLHLDTTASISPGEILARCQTLKQEFGKLDLVVIDYLQLLSLNEKGTSSGSLTQDVTRISRGIKMLAMKLEVPVIALSQMSRKIDDKDREDKTPKLSDLRESGAIEQDADLVFFLTTEHKPQEHKPGTVILNIAKNRHGEQKAIRYNWFGSKVSFVQSDNQSIYDTDAQKLVGVGKTKKSRQKEESEDNNQKENKKVRSDDNSKKGDGEGLGY